MKTRVTEIQIYLNLLLESNFSKSLAFFDWLSPKHDPSFQSLRSNQKQGWIYKEGHIVKSWKKRWFILKGNLLFYLKTPEAVEPLGIIPLRGSDISIVINKEKDKDVKYCMSIVVKSSVIAPYFIGLDNETEFEDWRKELKKAASLGSKNDQILIQKKLQVHKVTKKINRDKILWNK